VVKVFHAARQDLEIVWTQAKLIPHPIFDTQVAAMVCGFGEAVSYVNLVKQVTGRDLDKSSRFTDWSRRPLSQKQLTYALADVTYLRDIYKRLKEELESSGRAPWLDEEMATLTDPRTYETHPEEAWQRPGCASRTARGWPY
jgi:ribonuclease D